MRIFGMWDIGYVGILGMWSVWDVGVWNVVYLGCGMFGYGMCGICDVQDMNVGDVG